MEASREWIYAGGIPASRVQVHRWPIARYERGGCSWMLDKRHAGGGSTLNVGVHFIDLISSLTNSPITHVSAQMRTYRPDVTVEEQAVFTCRNAAGQIGVVETGYLYPSTAEDQRDFAFSISHTSSYVRGYADQLYIKARGQQQGRATKVEYNTDEFYSVFLRRSWADLASGCPPVAGLREAEHAIACRRGRIPLCSQRRRTRTGRQCLPGPLPPNGSTRRYALRRVVVRVKFQRRP
ncbi:Gfo/Idh/MocA family protein [Paraburkholderia sp. RAU6.4a]|uniref:Gfo/Idh/MocA family protein n=1 Tax=Paraburkholderia sp. RAU6.4a TaxID=2991067 RepID=UPI003D23FD1F